MTKQERNKNYAKFHSQGTTSHHCSFCSCPKACAPQDGTRFCCYRTRKQNRHVGLGV